MNEQCCGKPVVAEGRMAAGSEPFGLCADCADRFESYAEERAGVFFKWLR